MPSENQCMSSGAYEWPVLVALKHAVGLSQHWFSKFVNCSQNGQLGLYQNQCTFQKIYSLSTGGAHSRLLQECF